MTLDGAIKKYKEELKELITKFEKELNKRDFETIYNKCGQYWEYSTFTALLLKNNINPLYYMDYIPDYFAYGLDIKKFIIPNNIIKISPCAFEACSDLTSITIPNSVTSIGNYAFSRCDRLKDVYYEGSKEDWENIEIKIGNKELLNANINYNS